jgi:hypothetical protein
MFAIVPALKLPDPEGVVTEVQPWVSLELQEPPDVPFQVPLVAAFAETVSAAKLAKVRIVFFMLCFL